jgi:hypothetical protein
MNRIDSEKKTVGMGGSQDDALSSYRGNKTSDKIKVLKS